MGKTVNLTIDGKSVQVEEGTNLIDAAEAAGVHIPNLCYLKGMKGIGACRLCLVEVEGSKAPVIACNMKAKEGMNITTRTERVEEVRKFVVDLILSMHPLDCMTCTKAGVCNLQKYAYDFEIKESSFTRKKFGYPTDSANPLIMRDPEYCILCGRCIRICKAQGTEVLDFQGRGVGAKVVTAGDKPLQESTCTFCGSCVDVCPVNALLEADRWRKGREWEYEKTPSVCFSCGSGCSITVSTKDGEVVKVNAGSSEGAVDRFICAVGRFGFDSVSSDLRVTAPMKRVNGELKETTWDDAIALAAAQLKAAGADAAVISSGSILNEEAVLLKKLAADAVKTKHHDSSVSLYAEADTMNTATVDLETADLIVLAGVAPDQWSRILPGLDAAVRKKIAGGTKLIVINSGETRVASRAHAVLRGDEVTMLQELAQAAVSKGVKAPKEMVEALAPVNPSDEAMQAAELFAAAKAPVIFAAPACYHAAANLSLIKGDAVAVPYEANAKGIVLMGLTTDGKSFNEIVSGKTKAVYAVGELPISQRPNTDFLIVETSYMSELATQADLVLPAAASFESAGTMVDYLGRLKEVKKACEVRGEAKSHSDIIVAIGKELGSALKPPKDSEVKKVLKTKTKPVFVPFRKGKGLAADPEQFMDDIRKPVIAGSRLLWLKEVEKTVAA